MKCILLLLNLLFFELNISYASGGDTAICNCEYYSSYKINIYKQKIDSISSKLRLKYSNVIFIGHRSFATADLLFITRSGNKGYKGFFYDLFKNKERVVIGADVTKMADKILADSISLKNSYSIPCQYISHDFSFFVSFELEKNTYEVCYSQVLTVRDKSIGKLFIYYLNKFK